MSNGNYCASPWSPKLFALNDAVVFLVFSVGGPKLSSIALAVLELDPQKMVKNPLFPWFFNCLLATDGLESGGLLWGDFPRVFGIKDYGYTEQTAITGQLKT